MGVTAGGRAVNDMVANVMLVNVMATNVMAATSATIVRNAIAIVRPASASTGANAIRRRIRIRRSRNLQR